MHNSYTAASGLTSPWLAVVRYILGGLITPLSSSPFPGRMPSLTQPLGLHGRLMGRPPSIRVEDPADMFAPLLKKLFGSKNEREVKRMLKTVQV
ncbi:MAG: hypothetical protein Q7J46_04830, partial [Pseudomonas sp.]|nr:hypothetical protein [Pseudomonas sp.]